MIKILLPYRLSKIFSFLAQPSRQYLNRGCLIAVLACISITYPASGFCSDDEADLWNMLRTGDSFVLLRHAIAPGMGDPDHFILGNCSTQRNLSDAGRDQAAAIGTIFRANGIQMGRVFSSQWCRCLETARLLGLGSVKELPLLNSFFRHYERGDAQNARLEAWIGKQKFLQPLVLVTHQVNITSLTHFYPESGELVFARRLDSGEFSFLGSIKTE